MSWIQTYTGRRFDLFAPQVDQIAIEDIAHALAMTCRFNGHTLRFYSVAEHSLRVAEILPARYRLWGLLHDAHEAYCGDVVRPLKRRLRIRATDGTTDERCYPDFQHYELQLQALIAARFELVLPMPAEVGDADDILLATEARDLLLPPPEPWLVRARPLSPRIFQMTADQAEAQFLHRFKEYSALQKQAALM